MSEIRVIATIISKDNEIDFVKSAAKSIVDESNRDEGCIQYELHQDNKEQNVFVFFEIWKNQESLDKHNETTHLKGFIEKIKDKVSLLDVKVMSKIA